MLPDADGLDFMRELRSHSQTAAIPVVFTRGDATDRIIGLELGTDDYLPKPFRPYELARIKPFCSAVSQPNPLPLFAIWSFRNWSRKRDIRLDIKAAKF